MYVSKLQRASKVYVCDNSYFDYENRSCKLKKFLLWAQANDFQKKISIIEPEKYDSVRWSANQESVDRVMQRFNRLRSNRGDEYYLGGYMARRLQQYYAIKEYAEKISKSLDSVLVYPIKYKLMGLDGSRRKPSLAKILNGFVLLTFAVGLPLVIAREASRYVSFRGWKKPIKADLCLDIALGPSIEKNGTATLGRYSDTFLVEKEGKFALHNHVFIDVRRGREIDERWRSFLQEADANLITLGRHAIVIHPFRLATLIFENYLRWGRIAFSRTNRGFSWSLYERWLHILFHVELFRAQLIFDGITTKVYLSRHDYSPVHHVLGAECCKRGVRHIGLCHSPSGGVGYSPNMAILSFDEYLIYSGIFKEKFFPSWLRWYRGTIHEIGVWRSAFSSQWKQRNHYEDDIQRVLSSLGNRYTVGIHLPVPGTFLFDRSATEEWVALFKTIIDKMSDTAFIFFPRRISSAPRYFVDLIEGLEVSGRAGLSYKINPHWDQSYPWLGVCDLMVACNYSDVALESISCGVPALSYVLTGKNYSIRSIMYDKLQVYRPCDLIVAIESYRDGAWLSQEEFHLIREGLTGGIEYGHLERIKSILAQSL